MSTIMNQIPKSFVSGFGDDVFPRKSVVASSTAYFSLHMA